jgi:hypothetical protein
LIGLFNIEFIRQTVTYYIILIPSVLLISYLTYEYIQRWKNELKSLVRIKV